MKKLLLIFSVCLLANITLGQSDSVNYFISDDDNSDLFEEEFMKTDKEKYFYSEFLLNKKLSEQNKKGLPLIQLSRSETKRRGYDHYHDIVEWISGQSENFYDDMYNVEKQYFYSGSGSPETGQDFYPTKIETRQQFWEDNHRLQQVIRYTWSVSLQQCCYPYSKIRYYYTAFSEVSQFDFYLWQNNEWVINKRKYYTYDILNRLTGTTLLVYNAESDLYSSSEKTINTYDTVYNSSSQVIMNWDSTNHVWQNSKKYLFYNDSLNRPLRIEKYNYLQNNSWDIYYRFDYTHDENDVLTDVSSWYIYEWYGYYREMERWHLNYSDNCLIEAIRALWIESDSCFDDTHGRFNYIYDFSIQDDMFVVPNNLQISLYNNNLGLYSFSLNHPCKVSRNSYWTGGEYPEWFETERTVFTYDNISETDINNLTEINSMVFPNPAHNNVFVNLPEDLARAEFRLYDLSGKLLIETAVNNGSEVALYSVKPGIYVYKIVEDDVNFTGKLVVE